MVPGVVGSSPISHPRQEGIGVTPDPLFSFPLGRSQVVRQGTLTPSSAGSSPAVPAKSGRLLGVEIKFRSVSSVGRATAF